MHALILVSFFLLLGIGWYGISRSNRSPAPVAAPTPSVLDQTPGKPGTKEQATGRDAKPPYSIQGTFTLIDSKIDHHSSWCSGAGGFSDIEAGKQVTVMDATGKVIGVGALGQGTSSGEVTCRFSFSITGLPEADFCGIEVQRRGRLNYSLADMKKKGWVVELILSPSR